MTDHGATQPSESMTALAIQSLRQDYAAQGRPDMVRRLNRYQDQIERRESAARTRRAKANIVMHRRVKKALENGATPDELVATFEQQLALKVDELRAMKATPPDQWPASFGERLAKLTNDTHVIMRMVLHVHAISCGVTELNLLEFDDVADCLRSKVEALQDQNVRNQRMLDRWRKAIDDIENEGEEWKQS